MFTKLLAIIAPLVMVISLLKVQSTDIHFVIIIPSYNNVLWVKDNLSSVAAQNYHNWSLFYVDDCSTDETGKTAQDLIKQLHLESKATVICNAKRRGALHNIYSVAQRCKPRDVIILLDGDDQLSHNSVLSHLAKAYTNKNVWMTYGSFVCNPSGGTKTSCQQIPEEIAKQNSFRSYRWVSSHLRTFYAKLFQLIKKEDLLWKGAFFPTTWDLAIMFPMLEMASRGHYKYIKETLYVYNTQNPLMDRKIHGKLQKKLSKRIRAKQRYQPLDTLF